MTLWGMVLFVWWIRYLTDTVWDVNVGGSLSVWYRRMGFGSAPLLMDWTETFQADGFYESSHTADKWQE